MMRSKYDAVYVGLLLGLFWPLVISFIISHFWFETLSYPEVIDQMIIRGILSKLISLCLVPNLLVFFIFIWRNYLYSARGVVLATFLFGIVIVFLKYG